MKNENKADVQTETTSSDSQTQQAAETTEQPSAESTAKTDTGTPIENGSEEQKKDDLPLEERKRLMEADYTKKTQALAEEKKALDEKFKAYEEKAKIYDLINSNPQAADAVLKAFGLADKTDETVKTEEVPEEEIINKYGTKDVYNEIQALNKKLSEYEQKISSYDTVMLEKSVSDYGDMIGNEDFWQLHNLGLIEPVVVQLKEKYPKASNEAILQEAHKQARTSFTSIQQQVLKAESEKMKKAVESKKNETMDKGGSASGTETTTPKNFKDIFIETAKKNNIPLD